MQLFTALLIHQAFLDPFQTFSKIDVMFQELPGDTAYSSSDPEKSSFQLPSCQSPCPSSPRDNFQNRA